VFVIARMDQECALAELFLGFRCFLGRSSSHLCEQCILMFFAVVMRIPNRAETSVGWRAADFAFGCGRWNCHIISFELQIPFSRSVRCNFVLAKERWLVGVPLHLILEAAANPHHDLLLDFIVKVVK
jgi:hypothetical protein